MPVLDLDDFLKKNAAQKENAPQAPSTSPAGQAPFAAFTATSQQNTNAAAGGPPDFRQKTEGALASFGQGLSQLSDRVSALEHNIQAAQSKAEQIITIIDRVQPDKLGSEISDLRAQLSTIKQTGLQGSADKPAESGISSAVRKLEAEYTEQSSRLRPMEVALEQLKAWADRDKDYFIKTDAAHNKIAELERKIALKSDYPSEQIMSRAQFEKYSKMADVDRQQLRLSIDSLRDTVSQVSTSVDRLNSMVAGGAAAYGPQGATGVEAKVDAHEKAIAELRAGTGMAVLGDYSKELEKTRAEVSANYEQVKAVERLLTAQSNKMQAVFSEIQKNLSEYKLTSDTINSTHDAVLRDISALKAEHEHGIADYRRIAAELSQKVEQNARAVAETRLMITGMQYEASQAGGPRVPGEPLQSTGATRAEQTRLIDETNALSSTVADLAKKAEAFQEQAAKIASMEEIILRVEGKVRDSEANNAALFVNFTTGFSELKHRMEGISGGQDAARIAVVEKGFGALGAKINSIEHENTVLFSNLSKSVSKLKAQVDALQVAGSPSNEVFASADGRVTFASATTTPSQAGNLLSRVDALERSIFSLHIPASNAGDGGNDPNTQFTAPENANSLRQLETRLARLEGLDAELGEWKTQAEGVSAKVDALSSSQSQLMQEVASVISEKQAAAVADEQFSQTQVEETKTLLNELKVQTELLSSKLAETENNVSTIVGQRFSQLQTQSDRLGADLSGLKTTLPEKIGVITAAEERQAKALAAVDAKLSQTAERLLKAQQATGQQTLEFTEFRDAVPEKIRLAVAASESRHAEALSAIDTKQGARMAEQAAKIVGFEKKQDGLLTDFEKKQTEATVGFERKQGWALADFEKRQSSATAAFEAQQSKIISDFESKTSTSVKTFESSQSQMLAAFEAQQTQALSALDSKQAEAIAALDKRQADLTATLEVRESQASHSIDDLRAGLAAQKSDSEKAIAALSERAGAMDAFSHSISEQLFTTKTDVAAELAGLRKSQDALSERAGAADSLSHSISEQLSTTKADLSNELACVRKAQDELARTLQDTDSRLTAAVSDGFARSAASIEALSRSAASTAQLAMQKADSEKNIAGMAERMDTQDAFSRSISELLSATKTDVAAELAGLRKAQEASAKASQDADAKLSASVEGLARSSSSIEQIAARSASSTEQLVASISETNKTVASLRSAMGAGELRQEQERASVKASSALLEQKVANLFVALENIASLSRELDASRNNVSGVANAPRAAIARQAPVQATAERAVAESPGPAEQQADALKSGLSDLEKALAEMETKAPAAPPRAAEFPRQQSQFVRQPQPVVQRQATQYVSPPQQRHQEYYAPHAEQSIRREPLGGHTPSFRPAARPAQRVQQYRESEFAPQSDAEFSAQTEADKQAMDLMEELRGKILGEAVPKPEKKDSEAAEEKEQQ